VLLTGTITGLVDFGQFVTANGYDAFIANFNSAGQRHRSVDTFYRARSL
jgi:hypothetical protein